MNFIASLSNRSRSFFALALLLSGALSAYTLLAQEAHNTNGHPADVHTASAADTHEQPSLKETSEWLAAHFVGLSSSYLWVRTHPDGKKEGGKKGPPPPEVTQVKETVSNASVDGCHLTLTTERTTTGQGLPVTRSSQFVIPLDQMDNAYLGVTEHQPEKSGNEVETFVPKTASIIHLGGPQASIAYTDHTGGKAGSGDTDSGSYHLVELPSDDAAIAQRLITALNHAIQLCRASLKPEPF